MNPEQARIEDMRARRAHWNRWGSYLAERAWGTVREDYSPDGDAWEAADGGAQFGHSFDDFGHRFICYNRIQVQHVVIASTVLRRNPHLAFSSTVQDCPADMAAEPLKGHGAAARLFPISRNVTTADSHAGTFTAACAVTVYRGTGLPEAYRGGARGVSRLSLASRPAHRFLRRHTTIPEQWSRALSGNPSSRGLNS